MNPQTPQQPQMDNDVINLAKAIRQTESGGDFNAKGKSGESGAYQWTPDTWKSHAKEALGDENAQMTPENQNAVAYTVLKGWKDKGLNPAQISAKWNSGSETGWENKRGTNKYGVQYDVPKYVKSVTDAYQTIKGGGNVGVDPNNPSSTAKPIQQEEPKKGDGFIKSTLKGILNPIATLAVRPYQLAKAVSGASEEEQAVKLPFLGKIETSKNKSDVIKDVGRGLETVATGIGGGIAPQLKSATTAGKILRAGIQGAKTGALAGAVGGAGLGLEQEGNLKGALKGGAIGGVTGGLTGGLLEGGLQAASNAVRSTKGLLSKDVFVDRRKGAFEELFNSGVKTKKTFEKSKAKGYNVAETLAGDDRFVPEVIEGKVNPDKAIIALQGETEPLAKIIRGVIDTEDSYIPLRDLYQKTIRELDGIKDRGSEYERIIARVNDDFNSYKKFANDAGYIPLSKVDDFKKAKYDAVNWNDPERLSADRALGKAARETIESNIKDTSIRDMNHELGKLYDAQEMLEELGGRAVKGGQLGKYFARSFGLAVGSSQGPLGSLIGGFTADKLADVLQTGYFSNPALKKLIGEIKAERPEIFRQAEKIIADRMKGRSSQLRLPGKTTVFSGASERVQSPASVVKAGKILDQNGNVIGYNSTTANTVQQQERLALPPGGSVPIRLPKENQTAFDQRQIKNARKGLIQI